MVPSELHSTAPQIYLQINKEGNWKTRERRIEDGRPRAEAERGRSDNNPICRRCFLAPRIPAFLNNTSSAYMKFVKVAPYIYVVVRDD